MIEFSKFLIILVILALFGLAFLVSGAIRYKDKGYAGTYFISIVMLVLVAMFAYIGIDESQPSDYKNSKASITDINIDKDDKVYIKVKTKEDNNNNVENTYSYDKIKVINSGKTRVVEQRKKLGFLYISEYQVYVNRDDLAKAVNKSDKIKAKLK